ncbi:CgeB family protein [Coralloluteibacterium stylophorae]|uniref:Glycosyltransferase n=1 Tax=Coralloluteibacterium stylophorae TaxID=1776034 RepID=A0A8J8AY49_9GAMM|nr:glycosyltransferase [Coralloluteibacterium stylophorae]MBS7456280.1 glycosyltransferase [Coralloluteibacterium stylophorae]
MDIVILGLSITSSWGNGHATTFRGLVRELDALGHHVTFLERDVPWYAPHRDLPQPPYCRTELYADLADLRARFGRTVAGADAVIVGSYVPKGVAVGEWVQETAQGVTGFYDIDTPVTLAKLSAGDFEYLHPRLIPGYDVYLSFTGGPTLGRLEREFGSPCARALHCAFDPGLYHPEPMQAAWDLGYLGTYSDDRQPRVDGLLMAPAQRWPEGRFVVAGPMYPGTIAWPGNVERIDHVPPDAHRRFYNQQRFTLNVTRDDMIRAGWSPSVRLFEAAACGTPIISDVWEGIEALFVPGEEILLAESAEQVLGYLRDIGDADRRAIGARARERVMAEHTAGHRAEQLVAVLHEIAADTRPARTA